MLNGRDTLKQLAFFNKLNDFFRGTGFFRKIYDNCLAKNHIKEVFR